MTIDDCKINLKMITILFDDNEQAEVIKETCNYAINCIEELQELKKSAPNRRFFTIGYNEGYKSGYADAALKGEE